MTPSTQTRTLVMLLALGMVTVFGAGMISRSTSVASELESVRRERWRELNCQYEYAGRYLSFENRLLLEEIPNADYSHGGAYFLGASNTKMALDTYPLPANERALIGNYSLGGTSYTQQYALLRYLIDKRGLLKAGGDRTLVVVALNFSTATLGNHTSPHMGRYFKEVLSQEGLYTYDGREMRDVEMSSFERSLRLEHARVAQFTRNALTHWDAGIMYTWPHTPKVYQAEWTAYVGPDWKTEMRAELREVARMVDDLRSRHVDVVGLAVPVASWSRALPFPAEFRSLVDPVFASRGLPIFDLSEFLQDAEFGDSSHENYRGEQRVSETLIALARRHLRRTAALGPACDGDPPEVHLNESELTWTASSATKGIVVSRSGDAPGTEVVLKIVDPGAKSFRRAENDHQARYTVEAFDARGCSSSVTVADP